MSQAMIHSHTELEDLARERLAAGDAVGCARASLEVEGRDLITVEVWPRTGADGGFHIAYRINGNNVPGRAIELLLGAYGAVVASQATPS